jgi:tRNA (guanine37-N1)-methyltransferase
MKRCFHLKIEPKQAQEAQSILVSLQALNKELKVQKSKDYIYLPILKEKVSKVRSKLGGAKIVTKNAIEQPQKVKPLKELLSNKLNRDEQKSIFSSYDLVGDIAILDIPNKLEHKQNLIANEILRSNKKIKTIAIKTSATKGKYRIRKIKPIAGKKTTKTICVESGCRFTVDLNKTYYTNRFSHDRLDIASQVKPNENILVLFSGICPYPIVIEKHANPKKIIAIELNADAHKLALENIELNRCSKIDAINADVLYELQEPKYNSWADRILMPHPSASMQFFECALKSSKSNGIIHLYSFAPTQNIEDPFLQANDIAKKIGVRIKLLHIKVVRPFSKQKTQIRADIKVIKR